VMRLGKHTCVLKEDSKVFEIYKEKEIEERHRHKYIFNNDYTDIISSNGFKITGSSKEENIAEVIEMINHKWAIGVQYQPEFKSRPNRAHPLFIEFIKSLI
ncbi:MAG: gamma-glutamyl-gamma-aminobutyrate hydrolase family protein, partial [Clostridia bacterium]|nr:gamma-glutamyl-gamma-aminobutyrate hydrolase family protein [Clostridia bacterium]